MAFFNKLTVSMDTTNRVVTILSSYIEKRLKKAVTEERPIIALCIGSDRYTGDAMGPLIGSFLEENTICMTYGTLDEPVHAGNLVETLAEIKEKHYRPFIIAIDACLGKQIEIGNIEIWEGPLSPGTGVGNKLPCCGDLSVSGIVNSGEFGYLDLQSTSLCRVMKLSKIIQMAIADAISNVNAEKLENA